MFSRSKKRNKKAVAATVRIVKSEQEEAMAPAIDLSQTKITIVKPDSGFKITVEQDEEGEEDE